MFASLTAIFAKVGVSNVNSNLATAIRTVVIAVMIWSIVLVRSEAKGLFTLSRQNIVFLIVSGITTGLSWIFYFKALKIADVSKVAPVDKLSLALTIIFAVVFLGENLTYKTAAGTILIIAGTVVLVWK